MKLPKLCCTGSSAVAVKPQSPTTVIKADEDIEYKNAGLVAMAYMGRPVMIRYDNGSAYLNQDINQLYMKDGRLLER